MELIANNFGDNRFLVDEILLNIEVFVYWGQDTGEHRIEEYAQDKHKGRVDIFGGVDRVDAAVAYRGHNGEAIVERKNVIVHFG